MREKNRDREREAEGISSKNELGREHNTLPYHLWCHHILLN